MEEYLDLSDKTTAFIQNNGINVGEEERVYCYRLVTDTLKNTLYVSKQIAKRCRRKTVTCADLALAIEISGFHGALPFPSKLERFERQHSSAFDYFSNIESRFDILRVAESIAPPVQETPIKQYAIDVKLNTNDISPNLLIGVNAPEYIQEFCMLLKSDSEEEYNSLLFTLRESSRLGSVILPLLKYIKSNIIKSLISYEDRTTFYLNRLSQCLLAILDNKHNNFVIYDHFYLPSLFSVLFSKNIKDELIISHWDLRCTVAKTIATSYLGCHTIYSNSHKDIQETLFHTIQQEDASVECIFGCLNCILCCGIEMVYSFVTTIYIPKLYNSSFSTKYYKEKVIRDTMCKIISLHLKECNNSEERDLLEMEKQKLFNY